MAQWLDSGHQGQGLDALTPCKNKKNESGEWVLHAINYKKYIKNNFLDGKCAFFFIQNKRLWKAGNFFNDGRCIIMNTLME